MKIISANVNGIRAATKKGFIDWLEREAADVICIQETKAQEEQLDKNIHYPKDYYCYFADAEKKGYSGVAIFSKKKPLKVTTLTDYDLADFEGRYIQADFENVTVISIYFLSGSSKEERQVLKYEFMDWFEEKMLAMKRKKRDFIICGDWNIVHKEIDIKNFKANQKNSGCLPEERAWLDKIFDEIGFVDAFREVNTEAEQYTWWSNRGQAYAKNVGWRIDYHVLSPLLKGKVQNALIYKDEKFSDHAPLVISYKV